MARKQTSTDKQPVKDRVRAAVGIVTTTISSLLLVAIVVGLVVGREWMIGEASRLKSRPVEIRFDWPALAVPPGGAHRQAIDGVPNTWLDVKSRRTLEELVRSRLSDDPFDSGSLRSAQESLAATGWFEGPCTVARDPSGVVRISGDWREPVAAVRHTNTDYIVSARGQRLPASYQPDASGLKVVIGPQLAPPALGDVWIGGDVQAGLSLLDFLRTMPFSHQVSAIDVSEYNSRKRLLIITDRGSTIIWGGEPGRFHAGQPREDEKRSRLLQLFRRSGRIDQGQDIVNVSLSSGY